MEPKMMSQNRQPQEEQGADLQELMQKIADLEDEKNSLETLLDIVTEHSTALENQIEKQNHELQSYIQQVEKVTDAAIAVKNETFQPQDLASVAERKDELGELARVFTHMVQTVKTRELQLLELNQQLQALLHACGRFVPHEYLSLLRKDSIANVQLGDHVSKEMAIMFSDIRSFTTLSEKMTPQENFNFINAYLGRVSPEIRNHNGFIVKYLGDGIMAIFPNGGDDAIQAGIAKFHQLQDYNQKRQAEGLLPLQVGIGIHVGHIMVGMVGESNRIEGDALSGNVTLTARLEGLTKYYGVSLLISDDVLQVLNTPEQYQIRFLDRVIVKGRTNPVTIYEVLDAEVEPVRSLKIQTIPLFKQAYQHYCQGDLGNAKAGFEQMLEQNSNDKTIHLYLERIQQFLEQGIPSSWNGVWTFTQK
jgi:adenylate cyclase